MPISLDYVDKIEFHALKRLLPSALKLIAAVSANGFHSLSDNCLTDKNLGDLY